MSKILCSIRVLILFICVLWAKREGWGTVAAQYIAVKLHTYWAKLLILTIALVLFQQKLAACLHRVMFSVNSPELHICSGLTCGFYLQAIDCSLHLYNRTDSFVLSFHLCFQISLFHSNFPQSYSTFYLSSCCFNNANNSRWLRTSQEAPRFLFVLFSCTFSLSLFL